MGAGASAIPDIKGVSDEDLTAAFKNISVEDRAKLQRAIAAPAAAAAAEAPAAQAAAPAAEAAAPIPAGVQDVPLLRSKMPEECFTSEFHDVSLDPETGILTMEPKCKAVATVIFFHGTNTFGWMQCNSFAGKGWDFSLHGNGYEHQKGGGVGKPLAPANVRVVIPQGPNITQDVFKNIPALHNIASWYNGKVIMFEKDENGIRIPFGEQRLADLGALFDQASVTRRVDQTKELILKEAGKFEDSSTERIVLWGLSAGAGVVLSTLLQWDLPNPLGGVFVNSGYQMLTRENWKIAASTTKTPLMLFYGDKDTVARPEDFAMMYPPVAELYSGEHANNCQLCIGEGLDHYYDYERLSTFFATHPKRYLTKS